MDIYNSDGLLDRLKVIDELSEIIAPYRMKAADRERLIDLTDELADGRTFADAREDQDQ